MSETYLGVIDGDAPFWRSFDPTAPAAVLTRETIERAIAAVRTRPVSLDCSPHIVSPDGFRRGYGVCVNCGAFVGGRTEGAGT